MSTTSRTMKIKSRVVPDGMGKFDVVGLDGTVISPGLSWEAAKKVRNAIREITIEERKLTLLDKVKAKVREAFR